MVLDLEKSLRSRGINGEISGLVTECGEANLRSRPSQRQSHRFGSGQVDPNSIVFLCIAPETNQKAIGRLSRHSPGKETTRNGV